MTPREVAALLARLIHHERMRAGRGTAAHLLRLELRARAMGRGC